MINSALNQLHRFALTTTTTPYTANDAVGAVHSFTLPSRGTAGGLLKHIMVVDRENQDAALTFLFFLEEPTSMAADNAAFVLSDANDARLIGKVSVAAGDYQEIGGKAIAVKEVALSLETAKSDDPPTIWVAILTTGTPTYAVDSLQVQYGIMVD